MAQVLYRKYRSTNFGEVVGQDHITQTLERALSGGKVAHAYLFTGPKGVGKTSVARILAHAVNELPYELDLSDHLDIIEIDAASNRRIDEIRDLREKVHLAPVSARYKVYIIDEVHMLTSEAFNALLKTLEEPPEHVIFILATTEAHKVPETIISRTQRFSFRPIDKAVMVKHLADIAKKEKLTVEAAALELIAEHARGSFRDGLSLLDQLRSLTAKVDVESVEKLLGLPPQQTLTQLFDRVRQGDMVAAFATLEQLLAQGVNATAIARALARLARQAVLSTTGPERQQLLAFIDRLLAVEASLDPVIQLEVALVAGSAELASPSNPLESPVAPKQSEKTTVQASTANKPSPAKSQPTSTLRSKKTNLALDWSKVLEAAKSNSEALYALLRMAQASYDAATDTLLLRFRFALHAKRVEDKKQQAALAKLIQDMYGVVPTVVVEQANDLPEPTVSGGEATLGQVADILGGEVISL